MAIRRVRALRRQAFILSVTSEQEPEYDDWAEDNGLLSPMIAVRSELMRGDLRALYLSLLVHNSQIRPFPIDLCLLLNEE